MGKLINSEGNYLAVPIDSLNGEFLTVKDINMVNTETLHYGYIISSFEGQSSNSQYSCCDKVAFPENYVGRYYSANVTCAKVYIYSADGTRINNTTEVYTGIKSFEIDDEDNLIYYSYDNDVVALTQTLSGTPAWFRIQWGRGTEDVAFTITKDKVVSEYLPTSYKDVDINTPYKDTFIGHIFEQSADLQDMVKQITRPMYGKILVMFGDSEMQYLNDYADNKQMYKDLLSISAYRSYAVAGRMWETQVSGETNPATATDGIHGQFNRLLTDISNGVIRKEDIGGICWMMGTNGQNQGTFWAVENTTVNTDIQTMCGAAHEFMRRVLLEFTDPSVRLLGIIPIQGANRNEFFNADYMARHNLIRDIHKCWSIPFLDLQYECELPARALLNCDNGTLADVVHWSQLGMQMGIRKICGKLNTI